MSRLYPPSPFAAAFWLARQADVCRRLGADVLAADFARRAVAALRRGLRGAL